ncbi:MAG: HTH domain-containing protein [Candidatus Poseidoniaceae archaeon]|nr:HTH domain-containing protein [Candidatus Poseidoniaceae archaeon]
MRGVFIVRFLAFLAILSVVVGVLFLEEEIGSTTSGEEITPMSEPLTDDTEGTESDNSQESDTAFFSPVKSEESNLGEDDNTLSYVFFGIGGGAFSSLIFGSFLFEFIRVLFFLAFLTPLIATKDKKDERTRGRILGFVEGNAGIHFSALRDGLGLANGVTAYHLRLLENENAILSWRDGKLRRYAVSTISSHDIDSIRHPIVGTRLAILEILHQSESLGLTGKEIQQRLAISRQLLSHHMRSLRNSNFVEKNGSSRKAPWKLSTEGLRELNGIQNSVGLS